MPYGSLLRRRYPYSAYFNRRIAIRPRPYYGRGRYSFRSRRRGGYNTGYRYRGVRGLYNSRSVTTIPRIPLPNIMYLKFHYAEQVTGTVNNTSPVFAIPLYANNPYDPVVGASTVGCSGFNAVMSLYAWCMCFAAKITLRVQESSANTIEIYAWILMESHDAQRSTTPSQSITLDLLRENPIHLKSKLIYNAAYNVRPTYLSMYRRIKSIEGTSHLDPFQYRCSRTVGPAINSRLTFGIRTSDNTVATAQTARMHFKVTYYCRVYDRLNLDQ